MKTRTVLFCCAMIAGCQPAPPEGPRVMPSQVWANIPAWNGRDVLVEGWMGSCQAYDCAIYDNLGDLRTVEEHKTDGEAWSTAMNRRLSFGPNPVFDRLAAGQLKRHVLVRAIVTGNCKPICTDRGGNAKPIALYKLD